MGQRFPPKRVAIVEDESLVAMLIEDILTDLGHEVVGVAGTLDKAAELMTRERIDFALLDLNLNGKDTYSLASLLRVRQIPFAFATGYGQSSVSQEWRDIPVLEKPFEPEDLAKIISNPVRRQA